MLRVGRVYHELQSVEVSEYQEASCLVWLDTRIRDAEHAHNVQEMLLELHPDVHLDSDVHSCVNLIKTLTNKYILLVTSDILAYETLPQIHSLRLVAAVFVIGSNENDHRSLLDDYEKIVKIFFDEDSLMKSIEETILLVDKQLHAFTLFDQRQTLVRDPPRGSAAFLWHHLLVFVLQQMPADEQSKKEMLDVCTDYYRGNRRELKKIDQFRTSYTPEEAIKWYTRDCFLYRLLNKALRTENFELLYAFRFFIIDLCHQLRVQRFQWHKTKKRKGPLMTMELYRGQRMSKVDFLKLRKSVGVLISTNGFLSTSRDRAVSLMFAGQNRINTDDRCSVLFVIHVNSSLKSFDFADVYDQSDIPSEREVLFGHGASFKIDSVEKNSDLKVWQVNLTATDEGFDSIQQYRLLLLESIKDQSPTVLFGAFLWRDIDYIAQAKMYFEKLLQQLSSDHADLPFVYNYLAAAHYETNEFDLALEYYQRSYAIRQQQWPLNHAHTIASLHNIGNVYCEKEQFDQAFDYYSRALAIKDDNCNDDSLARVGLYEAMGNLFRRKRDFNNALDWLNRAYYLYTIVLPAPHPLIARCLGNIGLVHEAKRDIDLALKYFFEEFEMEEQCLSPDHPNLGLHLSWIITMYKKKGEWDRILRFYQLKLDGTSSDTNTHWSNLISSLRVFQSSSHAPTIYVKYYELTTIYSISPIRQITSVDNQIDQLTTSRCIRHLSACGFDEQKINDNNTYWLHALNTERRVYSSDHPEIVRSLRWVGESHAETVRNYSEALRMYSESMRSFAAESTNSLKDMEWHKPMTNGVMNNYRRNQFRGTL